MAADGPSDRPCAFFRDAAVRAFAVIFFVLIAAVFLQGAGFANPAELIGVGRGPLASMPFWLQAVLYLVIQDVLIYWSHRAFDPRGSGATTPSTIRQSISTGFQAGASTRSISRCTRLFPTLSA